MKAIWGVLALFALAASGCVSAATPSTLDVPTPGTPPSAAAESSPSPSRVADGNVEVASAMDRFFQAANAASRGQGLEDFGSLFAASCSLCATQLANFQAAYGAGQRADGDLYSTWDIEVQANDGDSALVKTVVDTGEITLVGSANEVVEVFPGESRLTTVWTLRRNPAGSWIVISSQDLP